MRLALALFLVASTAAASPKPFHCSAQGGRQWHEVKSAHFIVDTDAAGSALSTLVQSLENYPPKGIFTLLGWPADLPGRLRVVAFSSPSEFGGMGGGASGGYYWHSDLYGPYIVLPLVGFTADGETVAHELAHHVSFFLFPAQPHWFTEGFAGWVQTVATSDTEHGAPYPARLARPLRGGHAFALSSRCARFRAAGARQGAARVEGTGGYGDSMAVSRLVVDPLSLAVERAIPAP